jgi:hypothetical protein
MRVTCAAPPSRSPHLTETGSVFLTKVQVALPVRDYPLNSFHIIGGKNNRTFASRKRKYTGKAKMTIVFILPCLLNAF